MGVLDSSPQQSQMDPSGEKAGFRPERQWLGTESNAELLKIKMNNNHKLTWKNASRTSVNITPSVHEGQSFSQSL